MPSADGMVSVLFQLSPSMCSLHIAVLTSWWLSWRVSILTERASSESYIIISNRALEVRKHCFSCGHKPTQVQQTLPMYREMLALFCKTSFGMRYILVPLSLENTSSSLSNDDSELASAPFKPLISLAVWGSSHFQEVWLSLFSAGAVLPLGVIWGSFHLHSTGTSLMIDAV